MSRCSQPSGINPFRQDPLNFEILLSTGATAVAWDILASVPDIISFSTGDNINIDRQPFFGVTSIEPITWLEITTTDPSSLVMNLYDLRFGAAAPIPEPASLVLLGTR